MSYEIAIINPRGKRKSKKRASKAQLRARARFVAKFGRKKKTAARRRRKASTSTSGVTVMAKRRKRRSAKGRFTKKTHAVRRRSRRRSSGKRHPAQGYTVGSRKIRRRKLNPRASRRRRYRRNPLGLPSMGGIVHQLTAAGIGAAGAMAVNFGLSFLPLPDNLKTGYMRHGVRLAAALGLNMLAKKFVGNKPWVNQATAGALTVIVYDIGKAFIGGAAPEVAARLGEYEDVSLSGDLDGDDGFYDPASTIDGAGAYLEGPGVDEGGDADEMGAYMEGNLDGVYN